MVHFVLVTLRVTFPHAEREGYFGQSVPLPIGGLRQDHHFCPISSSNLHIQGKTYLTPLHPWQEKIPMKTDMQPEPGPIVALFKTSLRMWQAQWKAAQQSATPGPVAARTTRTNRLGRRTPRRIHS